MIGKLAGAGEGAERRITRLAFQQRDQNRVSVYLDGEFAFGLDAAEAVARGLRTGRRLTAAEVAELEGLADRSRARATAIDLLSRRPRSRRELVDRLRRKGFAAELIDAVLGDLERRGYVDDAAFARYWVENRQSNQPRGQRALAAELRAKGVAGELIEAAVESTVTDEAATALALARRRARSLHDVEPQRFRQRLGAFLQRKGYGYEIVREVVRQVATEHLTDEATGSGDEVD